MMMHKIESGIDSVHTLLRTQSLCIKYQKKHWIVLTVYKATDLDCEDK